MAAPSTYFRAMLAICFMLLLFTRSSIARTLLTTAIKDNLLSNTSVTSTIRTAELDILPHSNNSIHSAGATCTAPGILNPTIGDAVLPCHCFSSGQGQDRFYIERAIWQFCQRASVFFWSGGELGGSSSAYMDYWYNKDNTIGGIQTILLKWDFWADQMGTHDQCDPEFVIKYETCVESFHVPVDQCDTSRENGKHGGQTTSACLLWTVDTNPEHNNKEIFSSLTMPPSVWPTPPATV